MMSGMMVDRMGMSGVTAPAMGAGTMGATGTMPAGMNMMMVPRCTMKMEKCDGGMKVTCTFDDATSASMMQNLCTMMAGGMCSLCTMMNGMMTCCCNMMMAKCACEMTGQGCVMTCTSGDKDCCAMIQACCDCCTAMMKAGCCCCMMMNGMPVCCSC